MQNIATTQTAVLNAVLARIRSQVTYTELGTSKSFNETTMFLAWSADDASHAFPSRNFTWGAVIPLQGTPGDAEFSGAGEQQLIEYTGLTVVIFSSRRADQQGHAQHVLTDTGALLEIKRKLLKALTGWVPTVSGNALLINPLQPVHCAPPQRPSGDDIADLAVTFSTDFEWDLS